MACGRNAEGRCDLPALVVDLSYTQLGRHRQRVVPRHTPAAGGMAPRMVSPMSMHRRTALLGALISHIVPTTRLTRLNAGIAAYGGGQLWLNLLSGTPCLPRPRHRVHALAAGERRHFCGPWMLLPGSRGFVMSRLVHTFHVHSTSQVVSLPQARKAPLRYPCSLRWAPGGFARSVVDGCVSCTQQSGQRRDATRVASHNMKDALRRCEDNSWPWQSLWAWKPKVYPEPPLESRDAQ